MPWQVDMYTSRTEVAEEVVTRRRYVRLMSEFEPFLTEFMLDYPCFEHFVEWEWISWNEYRDKPDSSKQPLTFNRS